MAVASVAMSGGGQWQTPKLPGRGRGLRLKVFLNRWFTHMGIFYSLDILPVVAFYFLYIAQINYSNYTSFSTLFTLFFSAKKAVTKENLETDECL